MSRSKSGELKLTVGSRAVAVAIVAEALNAAMKAAPDGDYSPQSLAEEVVTQAWDVEYKPTAERLVLTLDAGIEYNPRRGAEAMMAGGPDPEARLDLP